MMWFLLLLLYAARIELVITQGEIRLYLNGTNSTPCEGHIEVFYNGTWGFVGDQTWDQDIEEVVCKSTQCGERVSSSEKVVSWSIGKVWLNQLDCSERPKNLWGCKHPGWGVRPYNLGHLRNIQCSNKIKLKLEGHNCSGVVKYSTDDGETYPGYFCEDNWGTLEDKVLCKNTNCGDGTSQRPHVTSKVLESFRPSEKKMKVKCSGIKNPDHLWQCVTEESRSCTKPASVTCSDYKRLQLKTNSPNACSGELLIERNNKWEPVDKSQIRPNASCQQMHCGVKGETSMVNNTIQLKCSDDVKVVLMDNKKPSKCYGEVYVEVNNKGQPVCASSSSWGDKDAEVVCKELNCGKVISHSKKPNDGKPGIMDDVKCSGEESSLWHCQAKHDIDLTCSSIAYVVCAGSVKVKLADGPGRCAGRLEIQHEGQWKRVDKKGWTDSHSNVVCKQMNCGLHREAATFSQGSGEFLTMTEGCDDNSKDISECLKKATSQRGGGQNQEVGIICQEHKVVILKGTPACSGYVGIVQDKKTSWLSGSKQTWNNKTANTVCQQMQCGNATVFEGRNTSADMLKNISNESYSCSSIKASLFDCVKPSPLPSTHYESFAYVNCSGEINATLSNRCWGKVNICIGTRCGDVCADTWTTDLSEMLCKDLGCGERALDAIFKPPKSNEVMFKSVHSTRETTNLTQCNLVSTDKDGIICVPAYVVCSDSVKSIMKASRDNCAGHVLVSYEGKELPVCRNALGDSKTRNTICKELGCDKAGERIDYFGPKSTETNFISQIDCPDNSESLKDCRITNSTVPCTLGALKCSSWKKIALTTGKRACSGAVTVFSEGKKSLVSIKGWTEKAGERLCHDLDCGSLNTSQTELSTETMDFSCAGVENPDNIWKCKNQNSTDKEQLLIECQDEPSITLSKKCHGEVKINNVNVCSTGWNIKYSHLVCQQSCGSAITWERISKKVDSNEYFHVHCEDNHYKLGQCKRFKGKCDDGLVSVYCTGQNVTFSFPGCGGQLSVNYRGSLEKVCPLKTFDQKFKDQLCEEERCGSHRNIKSQNTKKETLSTTLSCGEHINDINYCIKKEECDDIPAEIYCDNYVPPPPPPPTPRPDRTVPITLGVVFFLVLVILIVVFIRIYIVKRGKKGMNASSRMLSRQEVEFESGDYEDVKNKDNEMEDLSRSRFMPESEVITENDAQSASSLPYDDIDDMLEAQPLTPQAAAAGASGNNYMREGASDQSEDGVTYEVDDPQENYDDIEAGPEITQTEAEIHKIPQTAPESDTAPPPELVEGDDDYLVPGADG